MFYSLNMNHNVVTCWALFLIFGNVLYTPLRIYGNGAEWN